MRKFLSKRNVLIFLAFLFLFIAWNREVNMLYSMFALLSATIGIALVLPRHSIRGISVSRSLSPSAFEGDEIDISVRIENMGRTSRYMVEAVDSVPAAEPGLQSPMTFVGKIRGKGIREYVYTLSCYKRGEYTVGPLSIASAYPLGISTAARSKENTILPLLVYPQVFDIASFPLIAKGSMITTGIEALGKSGGTEDFFGTREFREGDSLRHIHWPSTAKHGRLVVKEFEIRASTEVTIVLDLQRGSDVGEGRDTTLEYAVKIAGSIAKYALEKGHTVQLIGYGKKTHIIPFARGISHLAKILESLARVQADGNITYPNAITRSDSLLRNGGTIVLLYSGHQADHDEHLYALGLLRAKRMHTIPVFMDRNSFLNTEKSDKPQEDLYCLTREILSPDAPVYVVAKGDRLQEVFGS